MKRSQWGGILLCILSVVTVAFGQIATTSLRGTLKDPSGAVLPGAKVTLVDKATGETFNATTSNAGYYEFPQIPPATYTITASAPGFGDQSKIAQLLVNQPATVDFNLTVQSSTITVDVSAEAQTLNTTDATLGNSQNNELIQAIPTETRNVPDLLALQPGVIYLPHQTDIFGNDPRTGAVNGGRSDQGNITIDGIDDNDQVGGAAFNGTLRQTQDSIEEFRVVTGNANSDSGRSSGAQVSMVTKSGTNKFHGAAYEYHRPTFTVANDWFNKQAQIAGGRPNVPGKLIRNIFGADVGGPVLKDKLFFFANYEGWRQAESYQVTETVPTASYQKGQIVFPNTGGGLTTLSSSQIAALDAGCKVCNSASYPNPPGPNPNSLKFFGLFPAANGTVDGDGLNEGSYSFSSPNPKNLDTYIAKLDYAITDKQHVFIRGQLQKDTIGDPEQFPGQGPESTETADNRGIIAGHTWSIKSNLINDIRYGFVRAGGSSSGVAKGDYVTFRFLSDPTPLTRTSITNVPVNNIVDNVSWIKASHTLQLGFNWRLIHQNHSTDSNSYSGASTNPYWLSGNVPGSDSVDGSFANSYEIALANMYGTVPSRTDVFNYAISNATTGSLLSDGSTIDRHFSSNEYEGYAQDAWRIKPNLTLTFGVRYSVLQTPWETKGQEVTPTIDMHAWYLQRERAALTGQIYEPDVTFAPAGGFYNKPGYWPINKNNFAPRLAIAFSPDSKTSIRAGAGLYYDHFGESLVNDVSQHGSFGLSSSITSPSAGLYQIEGNCVSGCNHPGAPRFIDRTALPNIPHGSAPATAKFPYLYPLNSFSIQSGLDNRLKTPYSEAFDLSVQRELPGGFTLEAAYVGRFGRRLLQNVDLAEPVDYTDPKGGGDYFAAGTQLARVVDQHGGKGGYITDNNGNPIGSEVAVSAIPYFENVFPFMANWGGLGESATQAIYNLEWAPYRYTWGATTSLSDIDFYCFDGCPANWQPHFWQDQFSTLYVLSSVGTSYYDAGQLTLRHPMSHGLQVDFAYTFSHSTDLGSDAERGTLRNGGAFSYILNTWKPEFNRSPSDFDTRHLITTDYVYRLPFGRGKMFAGNTSALLDSFIGGWQLAGSLRWTSGLPFSFYEPGWTTDWEIESYGVQTAPIKMRRHFDKNGNPQFFDDPDAINAGVYTGSPMRIPYPGEAGQRNNFRGDGYIDLSSALSKTWKVREMGSLKFAWEVYNATNTVRFDPAWIGTGLTGGNIGVASELLTQPRRMQFSLRFDF